jgi:nucleotide-binding universal stress UspA family protein
MVTSMRMFQHILFPNDGSERGREIVPYVQSLAERFHACVTIIGVVPPAFASVPSQAGLHLREERTCWSGVGICNPNSIECFST